MCLTARKFENSIITVIRVQKLSMPGTGGEPAGSPFIFGKSDDAQRIPYLPAADGESQSKYLDARCYATSKGAKRVLPKLLNMLDYIANKDTSHEYLAYYRRAYKNVPLWVVVNAMTFGQTSKMLTALRDSEKPKIAKRFGVGNPKNSRRLSAYSPSTGTSARMESVSSPTGVTSRFLTRSCTPSSASKRLGRITLAAR